MFENLQDRLGSILNNLTGRGALSEKDVSEAMREVRRALLEADVALEVVRGFTDRVREKAVGAEIVKSIKPGQMVVKLVHDELVALLGEEGVAIDLNAAAPVVIMMVGLQGSGKTTTSAKIAARLEKRDRKKVLMASLDTRRPAAQEQLAARRADRRRHPCRSSPASRRPTLPRARCRRPSSAAMTWSFSTPPAVRISTSR
jgi:signal recognition particle subunit SRP54